MDNKTNINYGKIPPQAIDMEYAVLGLLMIESDSYMDVSTILKPEMFYKDSHQKIYSTISFLNENMMPCDLLTLTDYLRKNDELELIGGQFYLSELTAKVSSSVNIEYYALIINQKYLAREGIRISNEISNKCYDDFEDISDVLDYAYLSIDKLNDSTIHGRTKDFKDNVNDSLNEYEKRIINREKGLQIYYTTGLGQLNKILIGFKPGELTILAARPSVGKTALSLSFAKSIAKQNGNVDIFSLEMTAQQITDRFILSEVDIQPRIYQSGEKTDISKLENAASNIQNFPISINDEMEITINYIRSIVRKKYKRKELGIVIIDYLQLMEGTDKSTKNNEIGTITRALKILCVKYNFPILVLSQLSRDYEKRGSQRHKLSDLRDSGNIEQDADNVIFLTRNRYDSEENELDYSKEENRLCFIDVSKNRNGALGVVPVYCNEYVNTFYEKTGHKEPSNYYEKEDNEPF